MWGTQANQVTSDLPKYPRIFLPAIRVEEIFDDAFTPIERDGASIVEVGIWLQKSLSTLAGIGNQSFADAATVHSDIALQRAEAALAIGRDKELIRAMVLPETSR